MDPFLARAFDALRFDGGRTLNLRALQPTASQARELCETWLRRQQVEGAEEVLVITGRGLRSVDGVSLVRQAVVALLPSLRRRNVISHFAEHTPGSFVVTLAPVRALFEAPRRRRERTPAVAEPVPASLAALEPETRRLLRELAQHQLAALGVTAPSDGMLRDEIARQFAALSAAVGDGTDAEARLQQAVARALDELDA